MIGTCQELQSLQNILHGHMSSLLLSHTVVTCDDRQGHGTQQPHEREEDKLQVCCGTRTMLALPC